MRNPPEVAHQPNSEEGALIFAKLWQTKPDEYRSVRVDTRASPAGSVIGGEQR